MIFAPRWIFTIALLNLSASLVAQNTVLLKGRVLADDFGPMESAAVYYAPSALGIFTDSTGAFQLRLPQGECEVTFSYTGYRTEKIKVNLTKDTTIEVKLKADLQLKEVVVIDKQKLKAADHDPDGLITLRKENFMSLPPLLGENDPIRAVEMQPGIQSGNEGANGIFVRGGSPDETLILLDGAPVFNPGHIYGFISVFNGDAIDKIDVYKDTYPAEFGGRLASVMDISSGDGSGKALTGNFTIGVVTSRFHLEGPFDKSGKTTFSVSARGSFIGAFIEPISSYEFKKDGFNGSVSYYFEDVDARLTHVFSPSDKLQWSFFQNDDFYNQPEHDPYHSSSYTGQSLIHYKVDWANYVSSLIWTHRFSEKWEWKNTAAFSDYIFEPFQEIGSDKIYPTNPVDEVRNYSGFSGLSYVRFFSLQSEVVFSPNAFQQIKLGAGADEQQFLTGGGDAITQTGTNTFVNTSTPLYSEKFNPVEASAFIQDQIRPSERWMMNCGFRMQCYEVNGSNFFSFLPHFNTVYTPVKNFSIRAAVSGLSQNLHLLTPSSGAVLSDYWVPATGTAPPETGWNYSLGVIQKLPLNFEWSVDGFYRSMKNMIDYQDGADFSFRKTDWEQQIATGGLGRAYGLEVYAARSFGRVTGSVAYTLAWSDRKFTSLNDGNWYPYTYDRRHDVAAQLNYLISKHIEIGAAWVYGSGNMITLPIQSYNTWNGVNAAQSNVLNGYSGSQTQEEITASTTRNNYRLPSYQHLDISFTYKWKKKKLEHLFNFSVYNVYNHFNVFEVFSINGTGPNGATTQQYYQLGLFPILPSLSYTIKFGV